jgi:hypothetical protein
LREPLMNAAEIQTQVGNGEEASGLVFERSARDLIVAVAHGSPYLASLTCHHAGLAALDANRTSVGAGDVISALERGLGEIESRLGRGTVYEVQDLLKQGFGPQLAALAGVSLRVGGEFELEELRAEVGEADFPACKRLVEKLLQDHVMLEFVDDAHRKGYAFIEEGVRHYLWFLGAQSEAQLLTTAAPSRRAAAASNA